MGLLQFVRCVCFSESVIYLSLVIYNLDLLRYILMFFLHGLFMQTFCLTTYISEVVLYFRFITYCQFILISLYCKVFEYIKVDDPKYPFHYKCSFTYAPKDASRKNRSSSRVVKPVFSLGQNSNRFYYILFYGRLGLVEFWFCSSFKN